MRGNSDISVRNIKCFFYILQVSCFMGTAAGFCPVPWSFPVQQQIEDFSRFWACLHSLYCVISKRMTDGNFLSDFLPWKGDKGISTPNQGFPNWLCLCATTIGRGGYVQCCMWCPCTMVFSEDLGEGSFIPSKLSQALSGFTVEIAL